MKDLGIMILNYFILRSCLIFRTYYLDWVNVSGSFASSGWRTSSGWHSCCHPECNEGSTYQLLSADINFFQLIKYNNCQPNTHCVRHHICHNYNHSSYIHSDDRTQGLSDTATFQLVFRCWISNLGVSCVETQWGITSCKFFLLFFTLFGWINST